MEQPLINEGSFSTENPSMAEIWPINCNNSGILGLRMASGNFGSNFGSDINNNSKNNNGSLEESSISGQSVSLCVNGSLKREFCCDYELKNSNSKRKKTSVSEEENSSSKAGGETGSAKPTEKSAEPRKDYIHVRARRGQATDSHSLAERARREKISEKMKVLQDLVPGCNKVIGKAVVLDEIINYVQSLQRQVEFLSMKLEAVNSGIIPPITGFHSKDVNQFAAPSFDPSGMTFNAQAVRELVSCGPHSEWLDIQLGGNFERMT